MRHGCVSSAKVGTTDAQRMSRMEDQVMLVTGVYSVGSRMAEVYPGWRNVRSDIRSCVAMAERVEVSEVTEYGGYGLSRVTDLKWFVGELVSRPGELFHGMGLQDKRWDCNKQEISF